MSHDHDHGHEEFHLRIASTTPEMCRVISTNEVITQEEAIQRFGTPDPSSVVEVMMIREGRVIFEGRIYFNDDRYYQVACIASCPFEELNDWAAVPALADKLSRRLLSRMLGGALEEADGPESIQVISLQ